MVDRFVCPVDLQMEIDPGWGARRRVIHEVVAVFHGGNP